MRRPNERASAPEEEKPHRDQDAVPDAPIVKRKPGRPRQEVSRSEGAGEVRRREEKVKPGRTKVIRDNPMRMGKDEMNLVEHPFAALWQKEAGDSVIFYEWTARHPVTGQNLAASWMVTGSPKFGLPTASDERVYLVLMELTREAGFESPTVYFSRYDIIRRLGWTDAPQSYQMLQGALDRLTSVTISAKNAFWNRRARSYINTAFHILDSFAVLAEPPGRKSARAAELPLSWFEWSQALFASFQDGYIRTLNLEFALSLKGDIAMRLYRYLDKKAYDGRPSFEIDLFLLCEKHLGMKPARYPSKLKERLKPAHDELVAKDFLLRAAYEDAPAAKSAKVRYDFAPRPRLSDDALAAAAPALPEAPLLALAPAAPVAAPPTLARSEAPTPEPELSEEQRVLVERMEDLKVSPGVAREMARGFDPAHVRLHLDCLDDRAPRDPAATLVKALRQEWEIPASYQERQEAQERAQKRRKVQEADRAAKAAQKASERAQRASAQEDEARLDRQWDEMPENERAAIDAQARGMLGVLGGAGRAGAALQAMRRTLLRQREEKSPAEK